MSKELSFFFWPRVTRKMAIMVLSFDQKTPQKIEGRVTQVQRTPTALPQCPRIAYKELPFAQKFYKGRTKKRQKAVVLQFILGKTPFKANFMWTLLPLKPRGCVLRTARYYSLIALLGHSRHPSSPWALSPSDVSWLLTATE